MSDTPWIKRISLLEITKHRTGTGGVEPLDMGYLFTFKNGETRHCMDDSEAFTFYANNKDRLDTE